MITLYKVSVIIPTNNRKRKLVTCIDSIYKSTYKFFEIIVVDNASDDGTVDTLKRKYNRKKNFHLILSEHNLGAAGGRNKGVKIAKGKYLLFIDSDNEIDKKMIDRLVIFMDRHDECGIVGPLMLSKGKTDTIWLSYADINMWTSQATYCGTGEKNIKQYNEIIEVGHIPNCSMIRKDDFGKVGGFDEKFFIMYEEADLTERVKKKLEKKIYLYPKAVIRHNIKEEGNKSICGFRSESRAYLTARNRVYFMRKNASLIQLLFFILLFNPLILTYYELRLLLNKEYKKAWFYLKGNVNGFVM